MRVDVFVVVCLFLVVDGVCVCVFMCVCVFVCLPDDLLYMFIDCVFAFVCV